MPTITFRQARSADVPTLVNLLADDPLGAQREYPQLPLKASYQKAFAAIDGDDNQLLTLLCRDDQVVGMMQLTFIPYLTHGGSWRCLVEGVRISKAYQGQGLGRQLFGFAEQQAKARGCAILQLTTDKKRPQALAFYQALGFIVSHEGLKKSLT